MGGVGGGVGGREIEERDRMGRHNTERDYSVLDVLLNKHIAHFIRETHTPREFIGNANFSTQKMPRVLNFL